MLRPYIKVNLFLVSYLPLFAILLLQNLNNSVLVWITTALITIPPFVLFLTFKIASSISWARVKIDKKEDINRIGLEYFVTYIIPFLNFQFNQFTDAISLSILFAIMCYMYIKSDLIYMNPILNMVGYNIFKIESEGRNKMLIIKKKKEEIQGSEELIELSNSVLLGKIGKTSK